MNEKFTLKDLKNHQEHCFDNIGKGECKVCAFEQCLIKNMEFTDMKEIYLYVSSRDRYYR